MIGCISYKVTDDAMLLEDCGAQANNRLELTAALQEIMRPRSAA